MTRLVTLARRSAPAILALVALLAAGGLPPGVFAATGLVVDGDFESDANGADLRRHETAQGWYESRNTGGPKDARLMLKLNTADIGGNASKQAMLKGDPQFNTYLTQSFPAPQAGTFALQWDIYVKEILPPFNRSAFQMLGSATAKGRGPNGSNPERFVFLGFENAGTPGRINLFAFEGKDPAQWDRRTPIATNLALQAWHTIRVDVDVAAKRYRVSVVGATSQPVEVEAFRTKDSSPPKAITHVSFATWDDGPGTFFVDNVREP